MVETLDYSKIYTDDLQFGTSTREVRLQDGRVVALQEFDPGWDLAYMTPSFPSLLGRGRTILIDRPITITAPLTIPAGDTLFFTRGGSLICNAAVTCNGQIDAGPFQIFSGPGLVTFPNGALVYADWWGAAPGIDSAVAITTALNAGPAHMHVRLGVGVYLVGSSITPPDINSAFFSLEGQGAKTTTLQRINGFIGDMIHIGNVGGSAVTEWQLGRFQLDGLDKTAGTVGLRIQSAARYEVRDISVRRCDTGIWVSGGTYQKFQDLALDNSLSNMILDNTDNLPMTTLSVTDSTFGNADVNLLRIDGSHGTALVRGISLRNVTFENAAAAGSTDIGVEIIEAEQVHFSQYCWFESSSKHVQITGGATASKPVAFITFDGCHFGPLRGAATVAFQYDGTQANDGMGSYIATSNLTAGIFQFNQTHLAELKDLSLRGATFGGTKWFTRASSTNEQVLINADPSLGSWRLDRIQKDDGVSTVNQYRIFSTVTTTGSSGTTLGGWNTVGADQTIRIEAKVTASQSDSSNQGTYWIMGLFKNVANTLTQIGVTRRIQNDFLLPVTITSGGLPTTLSDTDLESANYTVSLTIAGEVINVTVNGIAATTIRWVGDILVTILSES